MTSAALIVGTRPEAIKLATSYRALARLEEVTPTIVPTGRHGNSGERIARRIIENCL